MKILVVTQYFWPENMRINELVKDFSEKGHDITVLTGLPNYPDGKVFADYKKTPIEFLKYHGAKVVRVPMIARGKSSFILVLNYFTFFVSATILGLFKIRKNSFDNILIIGYSPIMSAIPGVIYGKIKKIPVFIWILDLWPESLQAVGVIKNKTILSMVGMVVSWIYNRSDYLLLQSKSFMENVSKYCTKNIDKSRLIYFPSWAEQVFSNMPNYHKPLFAEDKSMFTVVFAGNIGEAQDFPTILNTIELLKDKSPVRLVVAGDGRMFNWLQDQVRLRNMTNVILLGRLPVESMPGLFLSADALLVSLKTNEIFAKTIPGKIQAYLASGKAILGMIDGEASKVIEESGAGFASPSSNANRLAENILKMSQLTYVERDNMGKNGMHYYKNHFSKEKLYNQLEGLLLSSSKR